VATTTYTINGGTYTNGGYTTAITGGYVIGKDTWANGVITVPANNGKQMFALACIVLGMDTPELRAKFRLVYDTISSSWSDDYAYEFLIKEAYRIKYGDEERTD
jgi:hypothetical protein